MAVVTFSRVFSLTLGCPFTTREIVPTPTPACRATSWMVAIHDLLVATARVAGAAVESVPGTGFQTTHEDRGGATSRSGSDRCLRPRLSPRRRSGRRVRRSSPRPFRDSCPGDSPVIDPDATLVHPPAAP